MRNFLFCIALLAVSVEQSAAQAIHPPRRPRHLSKTTTLNPLEDAYDVKYVKLDLAMSNLSTAVKGNATTQAVVTRPSGLTDFAFELSTHLVIDSMKVNGQTVAVTTQSSGLRVASLPSIIPFNASFTAKTWYHGATPAGTTFFTNGLVQTTMSSGTNITFSLSDPYLASDWWPCKQSLVDKIDSADLYFTVPSACKAGSNGRLAGTSSLSGLTQYRWETRYPIEYYLISVSIAPYAERSGFMHYTDGTNDSTRITHYYYDSASVATPGFFAALDSTGYTVDKFSSLFGRYPFWKEKYGHCLAPLGGGMEHQTMTTLGNAGTVLIAHELGHQWWGDHVTYHSWADIWLSEGFASYCEQLFIEKAHSPASAQAYRTGVFNRVMQQAGGTVYVDDTNNVYRIFDSRLTYDKGAAVAHMLRFVAPSDSLYFAALRNYQSTFSNSTALTQDLKNIAASVYGSNLDTFFSQWIYGEGYPIYTGTWNQVGNTVFLRLQQTTSKPASVALFHTPIELRVTSAGGDTTIRVYNNAPSQIYSFTWNKQATSFVVDPSNHILNKMNGFVTQDPALKIGAVRGSLLQVRPNPGRESWTVEGLPRHSSYAVYSANGMLVLSGESVHDTVEIDAQALAAGTYVFHGNAPDGTPFSAKLIRE